MFKELTVADIKSLEQKLLWTNRQRFEHWLRLYFYPQSKMLGWEVSFLYMSSAFEIKPIQKLFWKPRRFFKALWLEDYEGVLNNEHDFVKYYLPLLNDNFGRLPSPCFVPFKVEWLEDFYVRYKEYNQWLSEQLGIVGKIDQRSCEYKIWTLLVDCVYWKDFSVYSGFKPYMTLDKAYRLSQLPCNCSIEEEFRILNEV